MKPYYQDDWVTIYHGDCREMLPKLPTPDFVLTDPPYIFEAKGGGLAKDYHKWLVNLTDGFDISLLSAYDNWMCFCSREQIVKLITLAAEKGRWMLLTWNKPDPTPLINGNYLPDTEYIVHRFQKLYGGYNARSRFVVMPGGNKEYHPTGKPLNLIRRLVMTGTDAGQLIIDPFMGGGTTLRAAKDLNRRAIGIEIEEKYCEIAARRLSQQVFNMEAAID